MKRHARFPWDDEPLTIYFRVTWAALGESPRPGAAPEPGVWVRRAIASSAFLNGSVVGPTFESGETLLAEDAPRGAWRGEVRPPGETGAAARRPARDVAPASPERR
jgi:hypothetical protein